MSLRVEMRPIMDERQSISIEIHGFATLEAFVALIRGERTPLPEMTARLVRSNDDLAAAEAADHPALVPPQPVTQGD